MSVKYVIAKSADEVTVRLVQYAEGISIVVGHNTDDEQRIATLHNDGTLISIALNADKAASLGLQTDIVAGEHFIRFRRP